MNLDDYINGYEEQAGIVIEKQIGEPVNFSDYKHLENHLKHLCKTDKAQKYTTEYTPLNIYILTYGNCKYEEETCQDLEDRLEINKKINMLISKRMKLLGITPSNLRMQIAADVFIDEDETEVLPAEIQMTNEIIDELYNSCISSFIQYEMDENNLEYTDENYELGFRSFLNNTLFAVLHIEPNEIHMHRIFYIK